MAFPSLTLLEEFLLLTLDDVAGEFYTLPRSVLDCATAGAVLMGLSLRRRVDNDLKTLFVTDPTPVGDPILDFVLAPMALGSVVQSESIVVWLRRIAEDGATLRAMALKRLEARGLIVREEKRILKIFISAHFRVENHTQTEETKTRIRRVVLEDEIPESRDMMLVALAQACGLFARMFSGKEFALALPRIELVSQMDLVGQAVAQGVMEVEAAIRMASGLNA